MKNKTVYKAIILIDLFLLTSPLMSTDPNDIQKFLRKPIFTFFPIEQQKEIYAHTVNFAGDFFENLPFMGGKKVSDLLVYPKAGRVLNIVSSKTIHYELKKRGVSRKNRRIAQYLINGAFIAAANLPAEESGKVSKKIVGIIVKQIGVNETYHYVVAKLRLDYPEFIKERPYLHKLAQFFCPLAVKYGMYIALNSLISKIKDPVGMKNHYKNIYK